MGRGALGRANEGIGGDPLPLNVAGEVTVGDAPEYQRIAVSK